MKKFSRICALLLLGFQSQLVCQEPLPRVSVDNIRKAQELYSKESQRAPYVQAAVLIGAAMVVSYCGYKLFLEYETGKIPASEKHVELIDTRVSTIESKLGLNVPTKTWGDSFRYYANYVGSSLLSSGILGIATSFLLNPLLNGLTKAKGSLSSSGDLSWYLKNRTSLLSTIDDMKRYVLHQVRRSTFRSLMPLFVADIEKVIGYIQHTMNNTKYQPLLLRYESICENLENWTNQFVTLTESKSELANIKQQLLKIEAEVDSAVRLVKAYS